MSFKETWKPRVDGVDDADSSAVNEIAEAVIELEEDIPERYYSKEISNNLFANALKGSASGEIVALKDVSPLEHNIGVKVSTPHIADIEAVKVRAQGKNLCNIEACEGIGKGVFAKDGDTYTLSNLGGNYRSTLYTPLSIPANTTVSISVEIIDTNIVEENCLDFILYNAEKSHYAGVIFTPTITKQTITLKEDNCYFRLFLPSSGGVSGLYTRFKNLQVELDSTATEYEPYKEPIEYTVNPDGTVDGVKSIAPDTTLATDTEGVLIEVEYNKDANKVVATLEQRLAALETAIISQ